MKLSEIVSKSFDVISEKPVILVPCLIPAILRVLVEILGFSWFLWSDTWERFRDFQWETMTPQDPMEMWEEFLPGVAGLTAVTILACVIIWIIAMIAFSMVISMVSSYLDGKEVSLSQAFSNISGKLLVLIAASVIVWGVKWLGVCALCIGAFIVWVLLALVKQGIIIDNLGLGGSLSKSYEMARIHFFDIMIILLLFFVVKIVVGILPILGDALGYLVDAFSVTALTILYIDRRT
jgi:hypothetical protein